MAQFDVHANVGHTKAYVVELQSDLVEGLPVRVVAPLVPSGKVMPITRLTPMVQFRGEDYLLLTYQLASVPARDLHHPVGSLADKQDEIKLALDLLFIGF